MQGDRGVDEIKDMPGVRDPPAEVYILKPEGPKALVKTTQFFPHTPAEHQERSRRLPYSAGLRIIESVSPVIAIDWIPAPESVQQ